MMTDSAPATDKEHGHRHDFAHDSGVVARAAGQFGDLHQMPARRLGQLQA